MEAEEQEGVKERNSRWWRMWCDGISQRMIAEREGVSEPTVSRALKQVRASIPQTKREEEIERSLEVLHELRAGALEVYRMAPAPVFVGKDGMPAIDPESGNVVRDHGGRLRAAETAVKVDESIRRMLGLDAATKMDHVVHAGEAVAAEQMARDAAARLAGEDPDPDGAES